MKKEYNLDKLKKRETPLRVDPNASKIHISLRLDSSVLVSLRTEAEKLGIPYQTFIGSVLHQYVHKELISKSALAMLEHGKI